MGKLIKTTDAAKLLGVTKQTIKNWCKRGILDVTKMNNVHYVNEDAVEAIADNAISVEEARNELEKIKAEYIKEKNSYWTEIQQIRDELYNERWQSYWYKRFVTSGLCKAVIELLEIYGDLNPRESDILKKIIDGDSVAVIAEEYGISQERIRQLVIRAARHSSDVKGIRERIFKHGEEMSEKDLEIRELKAVISELEGRIVKYEKEEQLKKEMNITSDEAMECWNMCCLLNTKLIDMNLTVRTLNCAKARDIETLGDLCKCTKAELLQMRNFGKKGLNELEDLLDSYNLEFGMDVDSYYLKLHELKVNCVEHEKIH